MGGGGGGRWRVVGGAPSKLIQPIALASPLHYRDRVVSAQGVAQLQSRDSYGLLPIHVAALHSPSVAVVRLLLERGGAAQLEARDDDGATAAILARQSTSREVARAVEVATLRRRTEGSDGQNIDRSHR
eukprot:SAG11_NODE_3174_length_2633_cov_4.697316_4_plen_129_part_00